MANDDLTLGRLQADFERLQGDYNATLEALQGQMTELEQAKARIAELEPLAAQSQELQGKLRGMTHEQAFAEVAKELGIRPEAAKDLWKLGDWKADNDTPDPKAMREHFAKLVDERPYLKADGDKIEAKGGKLKADENGTRGDTTPRGDGKLRVTNQQLNDLEWMDQNFASLGKGFEIVE